MFLIYSQYLTFHIILVSVKPYVTGNEKWICVMVSNNFLFFLSYVYFLLFTSMKLFATCQPSIFLELNHDRLSWIIDGSTATLVIIIKIFEMSVDPMMCTEKVAKVIIYLNLGVEVYNDYEETLYEKIRWYINVFLITSALSCLLATQITKFLKMPSTRKKNMLNHIHPYESIVKYGGPSSFPDGIGVQATSFLDHTDKETNINQDQILDPMNNTNQDPKQTLNVDSMIRTHTVIQVQPVGEKLSGDSMSFTTTDFKSALEEGENFNDIGQESSMEKQPKNETTETVTDTLLNRHSVSHAKKIRLMFTNSIIVGFLFMCFFVFYYVTNNTPKQMIMITVNSKCLESIPVMTVVNFQSLRSFSLRRIRRIIGLYGSQGCSFLKQC